MSLESKSVVIEDISDYTFNFKKLLSHTDTLIWKNCNNIKIKIDNKVNKIILNNCKNVKLYTSYFITGIELFRSKNITLDIKDDHNVSCIDIYSSDLNIYINKNINLPHIIKEKSNLIIDYKESSN